MRIVNRQETTEEQDEHEELVTYTRTSPVFIMWIKLKLFNLKVNVSFLIFSEGGPSCFKFYQVPIMLVFSLIILKTCMIRIENVFLVLHVLL